MCTSEDQRKYIEYFDHEKRGEILNILIMKKGGNILKILITKKREEYIESFSLLSADTVQRDLNSLGLKDSTYNVHLPPDSGGHFFILENGLCKRLTDKGF